MSLNRLRFTMHCDVTGRQSLVDGGWDRKDTSTINAILKLIN